jgi:hypothetical protein
VRHPPRPVGLSLIKFDGQVFSGAAAIQDSLARRARNGHIQRISAECAFQCQTPIAPLHLLTRFNVIAKPAFQPALEGTFSADHLLIRSPSPAGQAILNRGFAAAPMRRVAVSPIRTSHAIRCNKASCENWSCGSSPVTNPSRIVMMRRLRLSNSGNSEEIMSNATPWQATSSSSS